MTIELYFGPGACSFVPHVLLEASGAPYEAKLVKLHKGEQRQAEYLALNPRGQVPLLVSDGQPITQILAMTSYLAECFPQARFLPSDSLAKTRVLETLAWMNNTVHTNFTHIFMPQKFSSDAAAQAAMKAHAIPLFHGYLAEIDALAVRATAAGGQYLAAAFGHNYLTALDAYALTLVRWGSIAGIDPTQWQHAWPQVQQLAAMPAVARVIERERLKLNMLA